MGCGLDPRLSCPCLPACCQLATETASPRGTPTLRGGQESPEHWGELGSPPLLYAYLLSEGWEKEEVRGRNGVLETSIKALCWETEAGGSWVRSVSVPLGRGFMLYTAPSYHRNEALQNSLSQVCYVKHIFFG